MPTGFKKLDDALLGLRNNAVYIVAAATSVGKTSWSVSVARNIAGFGHKVLYITLEMSAELLVYRMLSGITRIPSLRIERGALEAHEHLEVIQALEYLKTQPITFVDSSLDTTQLMQTLYRAKQADLVDVVILDYLTLVQTQGSIRGSSSYERVTMISEFVRLAARDLDVPFIALAQTNREADRREDKTPVLNDIRDSGNIAQDAHAVILLDRPHVRARMYDHAEPVNEETDAVMILAKNRQGPTGRLSVTFTGDRMEWSDPTNVERRPFNLTEMTKA